MVGRLPGRHGEERWQPGVALEVSWPDSASSTMTSTWRSRSMHRADPDRARSKAPLGDRLRGTTSTRLMYLLLGSVVAMLIGLLGLIFYVHGASTQLELIGA